MAASKSTAVCFTGKLVLRFPTSL